MLPIKGSIIIGCISGFVKETILVCDQLELSLKACFEGSAAILIIAAALRSACAIPEEIFKQSVSRRMLKRWFGDLYGSVLLHVISYRSCHGVPVSGFDFWISFGIRYSGFPVSTRNARSEKSKTRPRARLDVLHGG